MEPDEEAALLGRIAVKYNFISLEQLAEATRERGRIGKKLGVIMLEKGMIDEFTLGKILALQQRHQKAIDRKRDVRTRKAPERKRIPTPRDWVFQPLEEPTPLAAPPRRRRIGKDTADPVSTPRAERATPIERPRGLGLSGKERPPSPFRPRPPTESTAPEEPAVPSRDPISSPPPANPALPPRAAPAARLGRFTDPLAGIGVASPVGPAVTISDDRRATATAPSMGAVSERSERDTAPSMQRVLERASEVPEDRDLGGPPLRSRGSASERPRDTVVDAHADRSSTLRVLDDDTVPARPSSIHPATSPPRSTDRPLLEPPTAPPSGPPSAHVEHLHTILAHATKARASDVILCPGSVVRMRLFGRVVPLTDAPLAPEATEHVLRELLTPWQAEELEEAGEVDFAYSIPGVGRFRSNVYQQLAGLSGAFHYIPSAVPTLSQLNLPVALAKLTNYSQGLILVTGPAGCGKTSTLAALLNILNEERRDHILTIEDPIEYLHASKRCVVNQRQVGRHTTSFARALRGALREDPDIICIGELRDLETISLALSAAETGHLVLATLHTGSAIGTITRIVGAFPPNQQAQVRSMMSESLRAVISQRLLPTADDADVVPALEILYVNKAVGNLIRENRTFQIRSILQTGRTQGMQLLDVGLRELVESGRVHPDVALQHCEDPRVLGGVG